ncbi:MAG: sugar phosphate isomerase/epimerase [Chloroflexota bacterium]
MSTPILLSNGSLYNLDIDSIMALAAETGFAGLELSVDWRWETHRINHLHTLIKRHDLPILTIHSPFVNMPIHGWPNEPVARIKASVQLAEAVGAKVVVVHPPDRWVRFQGIVSTPHWSRKLSIPLPLAGWGALGQWLWNELPYFQATTSVKIAVENLPCRWFGPLRLEPHHFYKPALLNHFGHITLDTTHVGTRHTDLLQFYEQVKSNVSHVHLSNYNGQEHQLLDDGHLPLTQFLQTLQANHYKGFISLELNAFDLHAEDESALRQNLKASLGFCLQAMDQAL